MRGCRVKVCEEPRLAQALKDTFQQVEVHAADQGGVLLGERVERAAVQDYVSACELWLEAWVSSSLIKAPVSRWLGRSCSV